MTKADPVELQHQAWIHADRGDLPAATAALEQAIDIVAQDDGPFSFDAANLLCELAAIFERADRFADAIAAARRSLAILGNFEGRDEAAATIEVRNHGVLSASERALGHFAAAQLAIVESLSLAETYLGPTHPVTAEAWAGLGVFHKYSGEFDQAEAAYRRALEILVPLHGEDSPEVAPLYHNLGGLHHARGSFEAGIPWARRAWEINVQAHGENSVEATADAVALAGLLDEIAPSAESERIYRKALEVWRTAFGTEHYEVATTLHNLAALRRDFGDAAEATTLFRQAYEMKSRLLGSESPDTALSAMCLAQMLDSGTAVPLLQKALAAYEANCHPEHPELLACRGLLQRVALQ